jgi:hypothetical protein
VHTVESRAESDRVVVGKVKAVGKSLGENEGAIFIDYEDAQVTGLNHFIINKRAMQKVKLLRDRLFKKNPNLTAIMNKSRIFNTYVSIVELVSILFYLAIPGRTNQNLVVSLFVTQSIIAIIGELYV